MEDLEEAKRMFRTPLQWGEIAFHNTRKEHGQFNKDKQNTGKYFTLKQTTMKNPKQIETIIEGATYKVPTYQVTNEGMADGAGIEIVFCKGNRDDESALRQEGVFTETLIQTAKQYLEAVNVGPMATRETSMVITKLDEALMWINKRAEDRKLREVQGTYKA